MVVVVSLLSMVVVGLSLSSTYNLHLASGCYSNEKGDKSDRRRYNSERRRCKSNVEEDNVVN